MVDTEQSMIHKDLVAHKLPQWIFTNRLYLVIQVMQKFPQWSTRIGDIFIARQTLSMLEQTAHKRACLGTGRTFKRAFLVTRKIMF